MNTIDLAGEAECPLWMEDDERAEHIYAHVQQCPNQALYTRKVDSTTQGPDRNLFQNDNRLYQKA